MWNSVVGAAQFKCDQTILDSEHPSEYIKDLDENRFLACSIDEREINCGGYLRNEDGTKVYSDVVRASVDTRAVFGSFQDSAISRTVFCNRIAPPPIRVFRYACEIHIEGVEDKHFSLEPIGPPHSVPLNDQTLTCSYNAYGVACSLGQPSEYLAYPSVGHASSHFSLDLHFGLARPVKIDCAKAGEFPVPDLYNQLPEVGSWSDVPKVGLPSGISFSNNATVMTTFNGQPVLGVYYSVSGKMEWHFYIYHVSESRWTDLNLPLPPSLASECPNQHNLHLHPTKNELYAITGDNCLYRMKTDPYRWENIFIHPDRARGAGVGFSDRYAFVYGGLNLVGAPSPRGFLIELAQGGVQETPVTDQLSARRLPAVRAVDSDSFWVWGGTKTEEQSTQISNTGAVFDPKKNEWRPVSAMGAPKPTQFLGPAPSLFHSEYLFSVGTLAAILGGWNQNDGYSVALSLYDSVFDTWTQKPGLGLPLINAKMTESADYLFATGGNLAFYPIHSRSLIFDKARANWSMTPEIPGWPVDYYRVEALTPVGNEVYSIWRAFGSQSYKILKLSGYAHGDSSQVKARRRGSKRRLR